MFKKAFVLILCLSFSTAALSTGGSKRKPPHNNDYSIVESEKSTNSLRTGGSKRKPPQVRYIIA